MARAPISLRGRIVAITGGARGIGKATARALVLKGAKVAIGDLDRELAEQTAAEIGGDTLALELDVTRRDSFEGFLDQVEERLGSLDVLINNAGIMPLGQFVEEDDATAHRMVDINVHGVMYGMKLALPRMQRRGSGHLVNIASQAGKTGFPGRGDLLRHQALRRRRLGGRARRAARHRDRDLLRDAGRRQHRARLRACRRPARSRCCSPRTSPTRSSARSSGRSSTSSSRASRWASTSS